MDKKNIVKKYHFKSNKLYSLFIWSFKADSCWINDGFEVVFPFELFNVGCLWAIIYVLRVFLN